MKMFFAVFFFPGVMVRQLCKIYDGKGWTVFQKRLNPLKYPFHRKTWQQYKEGKNYISYESFRV